LAFNAFRDFNATISSPWLPNPTKSLSRIAYSATSKAGFGLNAVETLIHGFGPKVTIFRTALSGAGSAKAALP
jgi:hypothetical protein